MLPEMNGNCGLYNKHEPQDQGPLPGRTMLHVLTLLPRTCSYADAFPESMNSVNTDSF